MFYSRFSVLILLPSSIRSQLCNPKPFVFPSVQFNDLRPEKPIPPYRSGLWLTAAPADIRLEYNLWRLEAIRRLWEERSSHPCTPIVHIRAPGYPDVDFVFKNESAVAFPSSAWRTAWRLIMTAVLDGVINSDSKVVDASSGNMAIAQAHLIRLIGLDFTAIVPSNLDLIRLLILQTFGVRVIQTDLRAMRSRAADWADSFDGGVFLDHFTNGRRGYDLEEGTCFQPGSGAFGELIAQLGAEIRNGNGQPVAPDYFVHTAESGSTLSAVGNFVSKNGVQTKVVLADSEFSSYFDFVAYGKFTNETAESLWVEPGIGVGYRYSDPLVVDVTTSLNPLVIDRALKVPDLATVAAMRFLLTLGIRAGSSTALSFVSALSIAAKERRPFQRYPLRIAMLINESGAFYASTLYNTSYINEQMAELGGMNTTNCWYGVIVRAFRSGGDPLVMGFNECILPVQHDLLDIFSLKVV